MTSTGGSFKVFERRQPLNREGFQLIVNIGDLQTKTIVRSTRKGLGASSMIRSMSIGLNIPARCWRPSGIPGTSSR
jgi:hypothetical protein